MRMPIMRSTFGSVTLTEPMEGRVTRCASVGCQPGGVLSSDYGRRKAVHDLLQLVLPMQARKRVRNKLIRLLEHGLRGAGVLAWR